MKSIPRISDTEWVVMKTLWSNAPMSAGQVVRALSERSSWKPRTIKTFLSRLTKKGAVGYHESGRFFTYFPLVTEAECIRYENESFLNRVHGGSLGNLLSSFLATRKLSAAEIDELKRMLGRKKE